MKSLIIAICFLSLSAHAAEEISLDRVEASVNSSIILASDLRNFKINVGLRSQLDPLFQGTPLATKGSKATDTEITEFLIDEKVIQSAFPIADKEVEQEINAIQAEHKIDRKGLVSTIEDQGYTFPAYFELIRSSTSKRNLIDMDIKTKVSISEDDIKNFYYNHYSKKAGSNFIYSVKMITLFPKNYKSPGAARSVLEDGLKQIKSGEPFEEVAKRISQDDNAASGGDLGQMTEDQMSPLIKDQLKKLKIGEVSEILGNPTSQYFILKLVDIKSGDQERYLKMKDEIRNQLATTEYQRQIALWLERQKQVAFIHIRGQDNLRRLPHLLGK